MAKNMGMTVEELAKACARLMQKGYGDKYILLSSDDEGNNFHTMFYEFATDNEVDELLKYSNYYGDWHNGENSVILG